MTEAEWLAGTNPDELLDIIPDLWTDRKLRLLAVACCRRVWHRLPDPRSRYAVEVIERFADGEASLEEVENARGEAEQAQQDVQWRRRESGEWAAVLTAMAPNWTPNRWPSIKVALSWALGAAGDSAALTGKNRQERKRNSSRGGYDEKAAQCTLIRDIFGNPFRPVTFDPGWSTSTALALAQQMYDSRDFSAMPILADALQDVGCEDSAILDHCRGPGPHVRGCWVVDLVLGQE